MRFSLGTILRVDSKSDGGGGEVCKEMGNAHHVGAPPPSPRCHATTLSPPEPSFFKKVPPLPDLSDLNACHHADIDTMRLLDGTLHHPVPETFLREKQPFVTEQMRRICIGWIMEVQAHFRLRHEIVHRCVNIFDRFMYVCDIKIAVARVQLVLVVSLIIACKVEQYRIPRLQLIIAVCDNRYGRKDMYDCERLILKKLDYHVTEPTAMHFLIEMCASLLVDVGAHKRQQLFRDAAMELELWLFECNGLRLAPFLRAAAALRFAMGKTWETRHEEHLQLSREEIQEMQWACKTLQELHDVIADEPKSPCAIVLPKFGICSPTR